MKDKLTPKVVAALAAAALARVALIGWFGLVSPQRSKAAELDQRIADAKTQLVVLKASAPSSTGGSTRSAPRRSCSRGRCRGASRCPPCCGSSCARRVTPTCGSTRVTPQAATAQTGYSTVPMDVVVTGRYSAVQRFLKDLRTQAGVVGLARARLRPAVQRRLGQPGRRRGSAAAARGDDPPERLHVQRLGRCCGAHGRRRRPRLLLRPRARRLPQEGHPDERYRDTAWAAAARAARNAAERRKKLILAASWLCSSRCSPSSCRS